MAKFIAELGSNHNQSITRAYKLMDAAAEAGCDGVKFQLFRIDELFAPGHVPENWPGAQLPKRWIPDLAEKAHARGLEFGCSIFHIADLEDVAHELDFIKISSYDILRLDLIRAAAATGRPLVVSTGMATTDQVGDAVRAVGNTNNLTLLHCVSAYPTPPEATALGRIDVLRCGFDVLTGWSDHTRNPGIICEAFWCEQADPIEFHLDLEDGAGWEYGGHCWKPSEIAPVISCCQETTTIKSSITLQFKESLWRADPSDGRRPMLSERGVAYR
jgi:N-acetylneuraminate synthase